MYSHFTVQEKNVIHGFIYTYEVMGGRLSCASDRYAEKDPDRQPYTKKPAQFKNYVSGEYIFFFFPFSQLINPERKGLLNLTKK
jgi:hypothetical protein